MKKTAFILVICMMLSSIFVTAETNTEKYSAKDLEQAKVLHAIGILTETPEKFLEKTELTRGEAAELAVRISGVSIEDSDGKDINFVDVTKDSDWASSVFAAVRLGYMRGNGDYTFGINDPITYEQFVKTLLVVAGYEWVAENNGGYLKIAAERNLTKGVKGENILSAVNAVKLMYNALDTEVMEMKSAGDKLKYSTDKDKTILSEYLGIYKLKAIVTGTDATELYGKSALAADEVALDGIIMKTNVPDRNLLGKKVTAYYKESKESRREYEVVYIEESDDNKVLELSDEDVKKYENGKFTYYEQNDKKKTATLKSGAAIIYNGTAIGSADFDMNNLAPKDGKVTLIDNDNDDIYDTVIVHNYYNIKVRGVNVREQIIYDDSAAKNHFKFTDNDDVYFFDKNGVPTTMDKISEGMLVTVEKGDFATFIYVGPDSISGTVKSMSEENKITIGDTEYTMANGMKNLQDVNPEVGDTGVFFRDVYGKIAYYEKSNNSLKAGLLLLAGEEGGIGSVIKMKIFNIYGELTMYECADKVVLDGASVRTSSTDSNGKNKILARLAEGAALENPKLTENHPYAQVIRYTLNSDGKISEIDTAIKNAAYEDDNTLQHEITYSKGNGLWFLKRGTDGGNFTGDAVVDSKTIVFQVDLPLSSKPEEDIKIGSGADFANSTSYSIETFMYTKDKILQDLVVSYKDSSSKKVDSYSREMIVDKISYVLGDEGDSLQCISGYYKGSYVQYSIAADCFTDGKIARGDLVRFNLNNKNLISVLEHVYFGGDENRYAFESGGGYTAIDKATYIAKGYVYKADGNAIVLAKANSIADIEESKKEPYIIDGCNIYIYDKNDSEKPVRKGTAADLLSYSKENENASNIIFCSEWALGKTILIIK